MKRLHLLSALAIFSLLAANVPAAEKKPEPLAGTAVLDWTDDISVRIVDEAHRLLDRKTAESVKSREKYWQRDFSSPEAYEKSIEPNRERFKKMIGVVDPRVPVVMERFGDDDNPALVAETDKYRVWQVRWTVLEGVTGEGLLAGAERLAVSAMWSWFPMPIRRPEQLVGLAPGSRSSRSSPGAWRRTALRVVVPVLVSRACEFSGTRSVRYDQPAAPRVGLPPSLREWVGT